MEEDVSDEVVDDADDDVKRHPSASDVTFGMIPKKASRSHFSVDQKKIGLATNLKKQWKEFLTSEAITAATIGSINNKSAQLASQSRLQL